MVVVVVETKALVTMTVTLELVRTVETVTDGIIEVVKIVMV